MTRKNKAVLKSRKMSKRNTTKQYNLKNKLMRGGYEDFAQLSVINSTIPNAKPYIDFFTDYIPLIINNDNIPLIINNDNIPQDGREIVQNQNSVLAIYPGSFAPLHSGHMKLLIECLAKISEKESDKKIDVAFELSMENADKKLNPEQKPLIALRRAAQFSNNYNIYTDDNTRDDNTRDDKTTKFSQYFEDKRINSLVENKFLILTKIAFFIDKFKQMKEFIKGRPVYFCVGADTIIRVLMTSYYKGGEEELKNILETFKNGNVKFIVAGRFVPKRFFDDEHNKDEFEETIKNLKETDASKTDPSNRYKDDKQDEFYFSGEEIITFAKLISPSYKNIISEPELYEMCIPLDDFKDDTSSTGFTTQKPFFTTITT